MFLAKQNRVLRRCVVFQDTSRENNNTRRTTPQEDLQQWPDDDQETAATFTQSKQLVQHPDTTAIHQQRYAAICMSSGPVDAVRFTAAVAAKCLVTSFYHSSTGNETDDDRWCR